MTAARRIRIPPDHPALAGHFPGDPIVPGTLLLESVLLACPAPCHRLEQVKFLSPLRPDEWLDIGFKPATQPDRLDFECRHADILVCKGRLGIEPPP